jgi:arylsulfatase A-like enzyme
MGTHKPWFTDGDYDVDKYENDYQRFIGKIGQLDRLIKKIVDELKKLDMWKDTVFIVSGDHGESPFNQKRTERGDWEVLLVPLIMQIPDRFIN